jgi:cysteine-rich repeat protein
VSSRHSPLAVRRAVALLAFLVISVLPIRALAADATFVNTANGRSVDGLQNGNPRHLGFAGTFNISIDGGASVPAYCVDIDNGIAPGDTIPQAPVDYPAEVLFILNNAFPQPNTIGAPLGNVNDEAAAVQSALWHFTDLFDATSPSQVAARAADIVAAAIAGASSLPASAPQSIAINPPSATNVLPGDTSHSVSATLLDGDGNPVSGSTIDLAITAGPASGHSATGPSPTLNTTYTNAVAGTDTIVATADYQVPTGQKFKRAGKQGIVLAGNPTTGTVTATATKSWVQPQCGNGSTEPGEQCDDGNGNNNDACTNACRTNVCGDGYVRPSEQCDDGNQNQNDDCKNDCRLNVCGDQIVNPGEEECDDGNATNDDGCTNVCTSPRCGDGVLQAGETCDDGNTSNVDTCTNACLPNECGDGYVGPGASSATTAIRAARTAAPPHV